MGRHNTQQSDEHVFADIPVPRQPSDTTGPTPTAVGVPAAPQGWRARRAARLDAERAAALEVQIAHARRRTRQVAAASMDTVGCSAAPE